MKTRRSNRAVVIMPIPSSMIAMAVGVICVAYIQLSHSASIPSDAGSATPSSGTNKPSRISSLKSGRPRLEVQAGRMKASDIKACISKAFCEVNSASKTPNYAVNKEFFDLMNQINALSNEEIDSGSMSDEAEDDYEDDDDDASSEESSERMRGYPPPPPGYRRGRGMGYNNNGTDAISSGNGTETGSSSTPKTPSTVKKAKDSGKKKSKKNKTKKTTEGQKMVKKYVNGTFISVPKRRTRVETAEEKAEKQDYVMRKRREMGQVNDLAALIRISADIGLTLRNPRKCRTLFNKCTMSHEQIVDLFNQTLMAVTTPSSSSAASSSVPTTKRAKVTTTLAASVSTFADTPSPSSPLTTVQEALTPTVQTSAATTLLTTQTPSTTTVDDGNRSSKSRHDFSDEDVEYLTDTEIAPVQTYALFVNDAPEDVKTQEEINIPETFKKYANAFPIESALPGDIPSLRKRDLKKKSLKASGSNGRSSNPAKISKRKHASSEEDEDEEDEEEEDDVESQSAEEAEEKSGFRLENPYPGYRVNKGGIVDDEKSVESAEPSSAAAGKESNEGILPPLVQKEKPKIKNDEEEDEEESSEEDDLEQDDGAGLGTKGYKVKATKSSNNKNNKKAGGSKKPSVALEEDESSEEDEVEAADDQQSPPPWTPVYQMYMTEKKKQGYKKKQKGPYKGGEDHYADSPAHAAPQSAASSFSSFLKKPWGGSSNSASQEIPGAPPTHGQHSHSQESGFPDYHNQHYPGHGGPPGMPSPYSQETGGGSEQKPGFFQSIMSWFTGGNKNADPGSPHQGDSGYGAGGPMHPYGAPANGHYGAHGHGLGSAENDEPQQSPTGAPWPSHADPAGVGHFGQAYNNRYRGYRKPPSSSEEEDEDLIDEPTIISKKNKKSKRRYRGRSDSIITSPPKKSSTPVKKSPAGPPPPVVVVPKDSKSVAPAGKAPVGTYEPNHQYEKLIQADGGFTSGGKAVVVSTKENKRAKKAAVKPKQKKKNQKQSQRAAEHRTSRESAEDDDEAFSSEELYNQQVAKLKTGAGGNVNLGASNNPGGNSNGGNNNNNNKQNHSPSKSESDASFPSYFESMFGTEEKDKYKIKGKDDGSLLYGFDSLSSQLHAAPELPVTQNKKKASSYKVNKNKKKKNGGGGVIGQPVKFNNKEVIESSEEDDKKKK